MAMPKTIKGIMKNKKEEKDPTCLFVCVGKTVENEMLKQGVRKQDFAKQVGTDRRNLYRILKKDSLETEVLYRYSKALNHNFFRDLAEEFDKKHSFGQ